MLKDRKRQVLVPAFWIPLNSRKDFAISIV
ncbi:hypothetical protein FSA28_0180 [Streptococcus mutans]|nr:hypothetical protein FSA28_0180 [Streptococcus mutans]